MFAEHLHQAWARAFGLFACFEKRLRFLHVLANPQPDRADQQTQHKRNPPAPALQCLRGQQVGEQCDHRRPGEHRQALPDQLPRAVQALAVRRCAFHQERRGAGVFAARGEALQHPRNHDQQWRTHADSGVVRCKRNQCDGDSHQANDHLHRRLAPFAVRIHPQQDAAHRTHEEADAESRQSHQQGGVFVVRGEKLPGDDAGQKAVNDEVIPFQGIADNGGDYLPGARNACARSVHGELSKNLVGNGGHDSARPVQRQ
ncbi:hypothetical protein D3C78_1004070 [compost metagenome]